jgi:tRNA-specific 2-thiouridylase
VGLSMQLFDRTRDAESTFGRCCSPDDLKDARAVADAVGIPHFVMSFEDDFRRHVLDYFSSEYGKGRTPIPCIPCNSALKFGRLVERARTLGAVRVATGHYARVDYVRERERWRLRAGVDPERDQSYFLFDLSQEQLASASFPLGGLHKSQVRDLARRYALPVAEKAESRDLCFVASGSYRDVLEREGSLRPAAGEIVDRAGRVLGTHSGVAGYTVGQRRGLGLSAERPLYVLSLDSRRQRVVVGPEGEQYGRTLYASEANWVFEAEPQRPFQVRARLRYRHAGAPARVVPLPGRRFRVEFEEPQRAITPGQALVAYRGDEVLGGGWIEGETEDAFH